MKPVAIIGGGITGLTAAHFLKARGVPVKVLEASNRVGGVVQSQRREGHLVEYGPNSLLETSVTITELINDLGLAPRKMYSDAKAEKRFIVRGKKPVQMPASPFGMVTTSLFSPLAKLRLLAEPFIGRAPADKEESIAEFTQRRLGGEFLDYAIDPLVAGIYAGSPQLLSVKQAFPKLHALEQRYRSLILGQVLGARERKQRGEVSKQEAKKISFDEGLQVLIDTLQHSLEEEIQTGCPVDYLEREEYHWELHTGRPGTNATEECSGVLLALPAYAMSRLQIKASRTLDTRPLGKIYYPPVASVVLGFRREDVGHALDGFGMLVPEKEGFGILGSLFSSSLFPNRAPENEVTITSYLGGARDPRLARRDPEELFAIAVRDLSTILDIKGRPTFRHATVFQQAIPQYNVGYGVYREQMAEMERKAAGLFIAGHARDGISLSDSIVSGRNAAEKIYSYLSLQSDNILDSHFSA